MNRATTRSIFPVGGSTFDGGRKKAGDIFEVVEVHSSRPLHVLVRFQLTLDGQGGVEAVTLASVAGELSMTKQALFHYFPSKDALMRGLDVGTRVGDDAQRS